MGRFSPAMMIENAAIMRQELMRQLLDPRRDLNKECGYPTNISIDDYRQLYDRESVSERVVNVYPQESWAMDPELYETEDADATEWEVAWEALNEKQQLIHFLFRVDELSGVGHYGVLLLGLNDGKELHEAVDGLDERGRPTGQVAHELLYLRAFDESLARIVSYESDPTNPRFGSPTMYEITFSDPKQQATGELAVRDTTSRKVHWSRCIHVADNRKSSEVLGTPRMQPVFNRLHDLRKLLGGSAEMFWKGAFPGYSFEVNPDLGNVEINEATLRAEFDAYSNGLQRYLALTGVQAKSLAVQVSDPEKHIEAQLRAIAITLGVPLRVFMGSEQAQLASAQDARAWNKRLERRQKKYLTPMLIRPFVDRLMHLGVLPTVETYFVDWPDLNSPTDEDKAAVAAKRTEALAKYVAGGVDTLIPPLEFLTLIMGLTQEEAEAIEKAAIKHIEGANPDADPDSIVPGRNPAPPELELPAAERGQDGTPKPSPKPTKKSASPVR